MNMSINKASSYFDAIRVEPRQLTKEERISSNNRKIAVLEEQLTGEKESRVIIKEMITNNEALINNGNRKIDILEQLKASSDRLIGTHQEQRGLMVEARDLAIGARDAAVKVVDATSKVVDAYRESRDINQKMINITERMIDIMMKDPAKYGGLPNDEIQKQPEVTEAKTQVVQLANSKASEYPKGERAVLADIANNVVDATFFEIKATDIKANREILINLPKRIEAVLDKKHESLSVKDIKQIITDHYKYSRAVL